MKFNIPDPVAFSIGSHPIYWYGILIAVAILLGTFLVLREAEKLKLNLDHVLNIILFGISAAFIGARLYYVIFQWSQYSRNPLEIFAVWHGGLAIHGGLLGGFLVGYLLLRKYRINVWQAFDIAAPSIILGQAIGRWGNFFNQEAYGYEVDPADLPWAMYIDGAYRHPTFLYESLWNLSIFIFLLWLRRRKWIYRGDVFLSYVVLYSAGRFIIEGFRTDSLMLTGSLRVAQLVSAVAIVIGLSLLYYRHRNKVDKADVG
ncbi:MAG: prolipoprotein diacylglyceryl transferase [Clostridia bacterium]|jgi:phosphatidylglycerol:prolipoprotein diacylglycerol transferase|nr:prolipoprotein diacylglyceryl transferase [Clostridia bacterium]